MDRSDEIRHLQRELSDLRRQVDAVRRRYDGIPPLETWVRGLGDRVGDLLRAPSDEDEIDNLRRKISGVRAWLARYG